MFCKICKNIKNNDEDCFCGDCGSKLLFIDDVELPKEEVTKEYVKNFLLEVLGYKSVANYKEMSVMGSFEENMITPEIIIHIYEDSILIRNLLWIKNISDEESVDFFKSLNNANVNTNMQFSYIEQSRDKGFSLIFVSINIFFSRSLPMRYLYHLSKDCFSRNVYSKAIESGLERYLASERQLRRQA